MLLGERGAVSVETVIMLPVLILFYVVSFVFYDAFRTQANITRTGYVVGDLLSREAEVRQRDIDGMRNVFALLTHARGAVDVRVTEIIRPSGHDDWDYEVAWSRPSSSSSRGEMTGAELAALLAPPPGEPVPLPRLSPNERVVIVESFLRYQPPLNVGLTTYWMDSLVVTRPRYDTQLCWVDEDDISSCD